MKANIELTIGIPTFNRARHLDLSLSYICNEAGNNSDVEILICDNYSTDNTEEIVKKYQAIYSNIKYIKQESNLGFDRNLKTIFDLAKGNFIKPHGDDDFMQPGAIEELLQIIKENRNIDLFYINIGIRDRIRLGTGYDSYITALRQSNGITFLTALIISKAAYDMIEEKEKFLDSQIYQLYLQMEVLKINPNYGLIGHMGFPRSGWAARRFYNVGEVFIKNYFDILYEYEKHGLSKRAIADEKKFLLDNIIKKLANIAEKNVIGEGISKDNLEEIFVKYYKDEDYFLNELDDIKLIEKK